MADKELTDEQAAKMEEQLNAHRLRKQREREAEMREAAKPLTDIVNGDAFKGMIFALPVMQELVDKIPQLPDYRVHLEALRLGLINIAQLVQSIPPEVPASEQVVENP